MYAHRIENIHNTLKHPDENSGTYCVMSFCFGTDCPRESHPCGPNILSTMGLSLSVILI